MLRLCFLVMCMNRSPKVLPQTRMPDLANQIWQYSTNAFIPKIDKQFKEAVALLGFNIEKTGKKANRTVKDYSMGLQIRYQCYPFNLASLARERYRFPLRDSSNKDVCEHQDQRAERSIGQVTTSK